jgi:hypothetical protein
MAHHRFKVGQLVDFAPSRPGVPAPGRQYEIIRLLPAGGGEFQYWVKSKSEPFERVAKESELSRRSEWPFFAPGLRVARGAARRAWARLVGTLRVPLEPTLLDPHCYQGGLSPPARRCDHGIDRFEAVLHTE